MPNEHPASNEPVEPEDQFVWHVTVERCGTAREFTFISPDGLDRALAAAKNFLGKRYPNRFTADARFAGNDESDRYYRECPHDPEILIIGLKRGYELSSAVESEW